LGFCPRSNVAAKKLIARFAALEMVRAATGAHWLGDQRNTQGDRETTDPAAAARAVCARCA